LNEEENTFTEEALRKIVRDYTREADGRNLERQVGAICLMRCATPCFL